MGCFIIVLITLFFSCLMDVFYPAALGSVTCRSQLRPESACHSCPAWHGMAPRKTRRNIKEMNEDGNNMETTGDKLLLN
jgi:hypothetical protein